EDGERIEETTRRGYLRYELAMSSVLLLTGLLIWLGVAGHVRQEEIDRKNDDDLRKDEMDLLKDALRHEKRCQKRVDRSRQCDCQEVANLRIAEQFHAAWSLAKSASDYDELAWRNAAEQLSS